MKNITEPATVAALKKIYEASAPGQLKWDFSTPGQLQAYGRLNVSKGVLTGLKLNWCRLDDLSPLSGLASLKTLDLNYNEISDLSPLAGLTKLKTLDLCENEISDLSPLAGLANLLTLEIRDNKTNDLSPLSRLPKLGLVNGEKFRRPRGKK